MLKTTSFFLAILLFIYLGESIRVIYHLYTLFCLGFLYDTTQESPGFVPFGANLTFWEKPEPFSLTQTFYNSENFPLSVCDSGAKEDDYPVSEDILNADTPPTLPQTTVVTQGTSSSSESNGLGGVTFVQCATGRCSPVTASPVGSLDRCKLYILSSMGYFIILTI